ncbi:PilN domain-containing protein [Quadrisphaera sp. KR29]|uniref:PilN domain-containing protein n=1 Tax=Quadrisphaera sp. KR29 TaxID=3461391 RepID=UPI004044D8D1
MSATTTRRERGTSAPRALLAPAAPGGGRQGALPSLPRVNLLPPEVLARRAVRRVQRGAAVAAGAAVVVVAAAWGVTASQVSAEQARLDAANQRVQTLQAEQAQYAEAPQVIAQVEAAEAARATAMAQDVALYSYVDSLTRALPDGAWLAGVQVSLDAAGATAGAATTAAATSATAATGAAAGASAATTGSISITARSTSYEDVAGYLDALARVPGVADAYLTASSQDASAAVPVVSFTVTARVTTDALSHRYDQEVG